MDWPMEADQHWLVVSLVGGRRAVPMSGRASPAAVCKGRRKRDARAVIRRAVGRVAQAVGTRRVLVTADRGVAAGAWLTGRNPWGSTCLIRVKAGTQVSGRGQWFNWGQRQLRGNERHRSFGALPACERGPQRLWVSKSRARDAKGNWGRWHGVSHRS